MEGVTALRGEGRANGPRLLIARNVVAGAGAAYAGTGFPTIPLVPAKGSIRRIVRAFGPGGTFVVSGQVAKALEALAAAGGGGVTAGEVASWAYRLGAYVHDLRHDYELAIDTKREPHEGGWHGRYVLRSPVTILGAIQPGEGA